MMRMFGLQSLKTGYINGQKSCRNCWYAQKHHSSSMISSLMKALISEGNLYQNWPSQVDIVTIIYGSLQFYSTIPKNLRRQAKSIFIWHPKERADLKMIHDENNQLRDDELAIVRDFLERQNMRLYTYEMNILDNLRY